MLSINNNWKHNFAFEKSSVDFSYNGVAMATLTCFVSAITLAKFALAMGAGTLSLLLLPMFAGVLLSRVDRTYPVH